MSARELGNPLGNPLGLPRSESAAGVGDVVTRISPPSGAFLLADGTQLPKADYSKLYSAIGDSYSSSSFETATLSLVTLPISATWEDIVFGNGVFVAIASNTSTCIVSQDGAIWMQGNLPFASGWKSITFGNGVFVAVNLNGTAAVSADGINWDSYTITSSTTYNWQSITFGKGTFLAFAGSAGGGRFAYSTDNGKTWTVLTSSLFLSAAYTVCYGGGLFVALIAVNNQTSKRACCSVDGIVWNAAASEAAMGTYGYTDIAYGNGMFFATPESGSGLCLTSPDGTNWTTQSLAASQRRCTFAVDKFISAQSSANSNVYASSRGTFMAGDYIVMTAPNAASRNGGMAYGNGSLVLLTSGSASAVKSTVFNANLFSIPNLKSNGDKNAYVRVR